MIKQHKYRNTSFNVTKIEIKILNKLNIFYNQQNNKFKSLLKINIGLLQT